MTPFLPGYEPGTWVEIVSGPEMLCSLQYDYGTTFTLTDSLPYDPILGKQGKIVAILGKSGFLRLYFPHSDGRFCQPHSAVPQRSTSKIKQPNKV